MSAGVFPTERPNRSWRRCWRTTFWARTSRIVCVASRARRSRRLGVRSGGDCGTGFSSFALASVVLQGLNHERCVPRQLYLPVGVNQFCRFTSLAWPRCWAALVR